MTVKLLVRNDNLVMRNFPETYTLTFFDDHVHVDDGEGGIEDIYDLFASNSFEDEMASLPDGYADTKWLVLNGGWYLKGAPLPYGPSPLSVSGVPLVEPQPREGSSAVVVTHNWADKTTWYGDSVRVEGETPTTPDDTVFTLAHDNVIDLVHGKVYREDLITGDHGLVVYVDGVAATPDAPFGPGGDGDYSVNYATGEITFHVAQTGKAVTADYSYATSSTFYVRPNSGQMLRVEESEVQFSNDVDMTDIIHFQLWVYNPADPPNKVAYGDPTTYKTLWDFIDEAKGIFPQVPAIGGSSGRGTGQPHTVFPFPYTTVKPLQSSIGAEIRIWLDDNQVYGGAKATATFYCTSEDE